MDSSLGNVFENKNLRWIFVGGKGGVGKTTVSSCMALHLAQSRPSVLLVSTDPAHNLSDAFAQKIGSEPVKIEKTENLYAMEIDADKAFANTATKQNFENNPMLDDVL
ncbi:MAG: arsenical pump-driving ATPase, partial [Amphiamblys sp. WSBS2006]